MARWGIVLIIVLIVLLLWIEYRNHDSINGKVAKLTPKPPQPDATIAQTLDDIRDMVRDSYSFLRWPQALLVGLIMALPIGYMTLHRVPHLSEWFIMTALIAIGVYFSYSWIYVHFLQPNGRQIESNLTLLSDRLLKKKRRKSKAS